MKVEICASNFESARAASVGGADRIELCESLEVGGLTPSRELIEQVLSEINIPVHVLVRPRAGDFCYSMNEIEEILEDIQFCKTSGCAGIVSGVLTFHGEVDTFTTKRLMMASEGMQFTFHRAFDRVKHPLEAMRSLIDLGVDRVLSSGQMPRAADGIHLLKELNESLGGKIEIMPAAGIDISNVIDFKKAGFGSVHLSAVPKQKETTSLFNTGVSGVSDIELIRKVVQLVG
jgi:copper homeostasis protein